MELPATTTTTDENGITTIISWKYNEKGQRVKVTKKVRITEEKQTVLKRVVDRSHIIPFGLPAGGNEGVTMKAVEEIHMEKPNIDEESEEKAKTPMNGFVCRYCKGPHMSVKCPYKDMYMPKEQPKEEATPASPAQLKSHYVPPALRRSVEKTSEYKEEDNGYAIRISNLSEDVDDQQLRAMFGQCGFVTRARVITNFDTKRSRGFAFVNYNTKEEADRAIEMYNGYAINHLILSVAYAEKRKPSTTRYQTGYGKALPQNMKR